MNRIILLIVCTITWSACGSKKKLANNDSKSASQESKVFDSTIKSFEMNSLTYYTFSGRAKAKVQFDGNSHDATTHIRIDKNKAIWISVTALFNIEIARMLITPDSVKILTKFPKRELIQKPFSYIYQYTNSGITFPVLEDILVGNISTDLLRTGQIQIASADNDIVIVGNKADLGFQYGMNEHKRPYGTKIEDRKVKHNLDVSYNNYQNINGHFFPQRFVLKVLGDGVDIKADLEYNRLIFNEKIEMPFK